MNLRLGAVPLKGRTVGGDGGHRYLHNEAAGFFGKAGIWVVPRKATRLFVPDARQGAGAKGLFCAVKTADEDDL